MTPPDARPILFLIAGPNGAGKTTFYETVLKPRIKAPFINADQIQRDELKDASMKASYKAAEIAGERRQKLIQAEHSFITETVFSHPSKLDLLASARKAGFRLVVFHLHVATDDLSVVRVAERVREGGHPVPEDKIRARHARGQALIREAVLMADRAAVYDASALNQVPQQLLAFTAGAISTCAKSMPEWADQLYRTEIDGWKMNHA